MARSPTGACGAQPRAKPGTAIGDARWPRKEARTSRGGASASGEQWAPPSPPPAPPYDPWRHDPWPHDQWPDRKRGLSRPNFRTPSPPAGFARGSGRQSSQPVSAWGSRWPFIIGASRRRRNFGGRTLPFYPVASFRPLRVARCCLDSLGERDMDSITLLLLALNGSDARQHQVTPPTAHTLDGQRACLEGYCSWRCSDATTRGYAQFFGSDFRWSSVTCSLGDV